MNVIKRKPLSYLTAAAFLIVASVVSLLPTQTALAAGSIYLSPSSKTVKVNSTFTVDLRITPGQAVTVVEATVGFNSSQLQLVSTNSSASPFDTKIQEVKSSSSVQISRAKLDPAGVNGSNLLITSFVFKALKSSGTSAITVSAANAAVNGSYTSPGASGATISFIAASCPSGQTGTPPNCKTPTTTTPTTPSKDKDKDTSKDDDKDDDTKTPTKSDSSSNKPAAPTVTNETAQYTKLSVTATTNVAAQAYIKYGTKRDALNTQTALTKSGTTHSFVIEKGLTPGLELFYVVVAQNSSGTSQTEVKSVKLKGLDVKAALIDNALKPIKNQKVTVQPLGLEAKSDGNGYVLIEGLAPGDYTIEFAVADTTYAQHLNVASNVQTEDGQEVAGVQTAALVYDGYTGANAIPLLWIWVIVGVAIAGAVIAAGYILNRRGLLKDPFKAYRSKTHGVEGVIATNAAKHTPSNTGNGSYNPFGNQSSGSSSSQASGSTPQSAPQPPANPFFNQGSPSNPANSSSPSDPSQQGGKHNA